MLDSPETPATPAVSIILPTYNRARFLPQAFESIRAQTFTDWELIVVDDGSSDDTAAIVEVESRKTPQRVVFIRQENKGPYGARNTGLDHARGRYLAFYDSDDAWLPHHLQRCVESLDANANVAWVYGACRVAEYPSGRVLDEHTFYQNGKPRPFLSLKVERSGPLHIIDDPDLLPCVYLHGIYAGLQNSVLRREFFENYRFPTHLRNEAEDQVVKTWFTKAGHRFGYLPDIHVIYNVHQENSSASSQGMPIDKRLKVLGAIIQGYEEMQSQAPLTARERRALNTRLASELFWSVGYALLWQNGRRAEAMGYFRQGLKRKPLDLCFWKTYLVAGVKYYLSRP
jgi:glycosyltransferase involved in cell wall biosynthesis